MKNLLKKLLALLLCSVFIVFACKKHEAEVSTDAVTENETETSGESEANITEVKTNTSGFVYVNEASLYVETDDGTMKWAKSVVLGDAATYLNEKKTAVRSDGPKRDFFHIAYNGEEYWIQDYCFEPNTRPAFISKPDTLLYKNDSLTGVTDEIIPQYLIVAVYNDSVENADNKFVKIAAYSSEFYTSWIVKDKFVKRENLELDENNVKAMILTQIASASKNETIRTELFQNAIEMNSSYSDDIAEIQRLTEVKIKEADYLASVSPEKTEESVILAADTELLSIPSISDARILETVKEGTKAVAYRKLTLYGTEDEPVDWYYIESKQKKGWLQAKALKDKVQ